MYRGDVEFRDGLLEVAEQVVDRSLLGRHYLHIGFKNLREGARLKRFFYALRPAAVLRWMRDNPDRAVPPMQLMTALSESTAPRDVVEATTELIGLKAVTRELGAGEVPGVLREFAEAAGRYEGAEASDRAEARAVCEAFFQRVAN